MIPLQNMFTTVQRFRVIWMFPFQRNFRFDDVHSAGEKHLSAFTNAIGVTEYLITILWKNWELCCGVRVVANLLLWKSCAQGIYFHFVSIGAWGILSFLMHATVIHIVGWQDRPCGLPCCEHCFTTGLLHQSVITVYNWWVARRWRDCTSRTKRVYGPHTASRGLMTGDFNIASNYTPMFAHAGKAKMLAAPVGLL